jgi:hypothetical protein
MTPELKNLVDLVLKLGDWVNTITNFQILMNLAVLGWLFSSNEPWPIYQRIVIAIGFAVFALYNIASQHENHNRLQVALSELKAAVDYSQITDDPAKRAVLHTDAFKKMLREDRVFNTWLITIGYILWDSLVVLLILFSHLWKR